MRFGELENTREVLRPQEGPQHDAEEDTEDSSVPQEQRQDRRPLCANHAGGDQGTAWRLVSSNKLIGYLNATYWLASDYAAAVYAVSLAAAEPVVTDLCDTETCDCISS